MIPRKKIINNNNGRGKAKCEKCGRIVRVRHIIYYKGLYKCSNCINRMYPPSNKKTINEALEKVYEVKGYKKGNGQMDTKIHVPSILAGKKVRLILIQPKDLNSLNNLK